MNNQPTRLIRLPEVIARTGYGKAWIYHLISKGRFRNRSRLDIALLPSLKVKSRNGFSLLLKQPEKMLPERERENEY